MRNIFVALATIVMLALPATSFAGQQATRTRNERGWTHVMCSLESSTGVCDYNGAEDVYAVVDRYESVTFILNDAASSDAVCEIYGVSDFDSTLPDTTDISVFGGDKINSTDMSTTQEKIQFNNIGYKYMYVKCTTLDATTTVTMQGSVGPTRIGR